MCLIKSCLFLLIIKVALCADLIQPCDVHDIPCLSQSTENFLAHTSAGIPQTAIQAIDPMIEDSVEVPSNGLQLKNVNVTGMKGLKIHDFVMNLDAKCVVLDVEADTKFDGDLVENNKAPRKFSGSGKTILSAKYNYTLVPDDKGKEFFVLGSESITCENVGDKPQVHVDNSNDVPNDVVLNKIICAVSTKAYGVIIQNLREAAKLFPKTAFFINL